VNPFNGSAGVQYPASEHAHGSALHEHAHGSELPLPAEDEYGDGADRYAGEYEYALQPYAYGHENVFHLQ